MAAEYVGLLGTALGAAIAACVNLLLSRQNVKSEELQWRRNVKSEDQQWMRNARLKAYKDFLSAGTSLHRACVQAAESTEADKVRLLVTSTGDFDEAYIVLQIVSDRAVFLAAREYGDWFSDFTGAALAGDSAEVKEINKKLKAARHSFLAVVRQEQGLGADKELLPALP